MAQEAVRIWFARTSRQIVSKRASVSEETADRGASRRSGSERAAAFDSAIRSTLPLAVRGTASTRRAKEHWPQIASTNPLERVNKEVKRRSDVIGIFPDDDAIIRLVGALIAARSVARE